MKKTKVITYGMRQNLDLTFLLGFFFFILTFLLGFLLPEEFHAYGHALYAWICILYKHTLYIHVCNWTKSGCIDGQDELAFCSLCVFQICFWMIYFTSFQLLLFVLGWRNQERLEQNMKNSWERYVLRYYILLYTRECHAPDKRGYWYQENV